VDLELIERGRNPADNPLLEPIWNGQELFRTEFVSSGGERLFRAWVPFHSPAGLRIARIDLDAGAADFLVAPARHNIAVASLGGLVLVLVALYAIWATRRAARLQVRQAEMEHLAHMGKMSAVLAHEIRNPLGTIKGFAQLIGERAPDAVQGLLEPILSEIRRLENLVNELLLYARPPTPSLRRARWEETLVPLQAYARQLIGSRNIAFAADNARLEWETDPDLLLQALMNLVRNSLEAIGEGAEDAVTLEVRRQGPAGLTLTVADTGPGLGEPARARLFEPFFTTKAFGTGLGLAITRNLVESLGGELKFEPNRPRGTKAILHFPNVSPRKLEDHPEEQHGHDSDR
jgi:two-component system sensor histidine kinase HydH